MAEAAPTLASLGAVAAFDPPETPAESFRTALAEANASGGALEGAAGAEPVLPGEHAGDSAPLNGGQPRAPDGRFAASETPAEESETPAAESEAKEPPAETPLYEPPASWKLEEQETFRKLPPEAQKFVLDRAAPQSAPDPTWEELQRSVIAPRAAHFQRMGLSPAAAIQQNLQLSDFAANQPKEFINWFMQQRGLTPEALGWNGQGQQTQLTEEQQALMADPVYAAVTQQNAQLQAQLAAIQQQFQQRTVAEDQALQQQVVAEANAFANAKTEAGTPAHPYFNEVRGLMGRLMLPDEHTGQAQAEDYETAYAMACRAHPEVSAKIAAAERAAAERERAAADRKKATQARQAAASVAGTAGNAAPPAATGDLRADLRAEFAARGLLGSNPVI